MGLAVASVLIAGALAIAGTELAWPRLTWIAKPLATALLLAIVGPPRTPVAAWVDVGIALSIAGDVALLGAGHAAFMVGLAAFLLAHLAYVVAFAHVAVWSPHVAVVGAATTAATLLMLRAIWAGAAGLRAPTVAYGLVITAMVTMASATVGGALEHGRLAAVGAALFYCSDASLALNKFRRPLPLAALSTMGIYWIGQIGIALAAR
jgi:uncharacterized membrane protein YhhN